MAAGPVVDQLASEYANQPVLFLEHPADDASWWRSGRFWAAHNQSSGVLPFMMVDSGHQISSGYLDFHTVYKSMIDQSLARPANAKIEAYWSREGDKVRFNVQVTNLTNTTLTPGNGATVHGLVYENEKVALTGRYVRAVGAIYIDSLAPNATATYIVDIPELSGVDWDNLRYVVVVDYRPAEASRAYDTLQAAFAVPLSLAVQPERLTFEVDPAASTAPSSTVSITGPQFVSWSATTSTPWLVVTPDAGESGTSPTITVNKQLLAPGWQEGIVTISAEGLPSQQIVVRAFYGSTTRIYLPVVVR